MKKILIAIVILALTTVFIFSRYEYLLDKSQTGTDSVVFSVVPGDSVAIIAEGLEKENLINSAAVFRFYIWRSKIENALQAGEYYFSPQMSIKQIAIALKNGQTSSKERTIRILEGWTIKDIDKYISGLNLVEKGKFTSAASRNVGIWNFDFPAPEFALSIPSGQGLEGYLFPDTYRIFNDADENEIIERLLLNFGGRVTEEMVNDTVTQGKTLHDIIIMASIIEKEVRTADDMKVVSGIFWNRIKSAQALESCATLSYILGVNKPQYSVEDTKIDSPYNTYQNPGLPPGPICNPGLNAINAAIYPTKSDYYYFLNRLDTGETIFSKTYDEHLQNKRKYLD